MHEKTALTPADPRTLVLTTTGPLDLNPAAVYLAGLSKSSRCTMKTALDTMAAELTGGRADALACPWASLRFQHTAALRAWLAGRYAPSTAQKHIAALRGVLKAAWRLKQMPPDDYQRAIDLPPIRGESAPVGRMLDAGEVADLVRTGLGYNDEPARATRDAALIALLATAGLRRSEAVNLDLEDWDAKESKITVKRGKGGKGRAVFVAAKVGKLLEGWISERGKDVGPLFLPVHKSGKVTWRRLSPQSVQYILKKRGDEAGVEPFTPHDLRRTALSWLIEAGDLSIAQGVAGHADTKTTAQYDRRGEVAQREAVDALPLEW